MQPMILLFVHVSPEKASLLVFSILSKELLRVVATGPGRQCWPIFDALPVCEPDLESENQNEDDGMLTFSLQISNYATRTFTLNA